MNVRAGGLTTPATCGDAVGDVQRRTAQSAGPLQGVQVFFGGEIRAGQQQQAGEECPEHHADR